jgi:hypothetical protein
VVSERHPDRLNSDEVALVLKRAADLEARTEGRPLDDGFDTAAVEEAAREVGLSPIAVRQALAELHTGELSTQRQRRAPRVNRSIVQLARLVPCPPGAVCEAADDFLHRQTFELRRRHGPTTIYRQRKDLSASLRRGINFQGAIKLEGVHALTMTVTPVGGDDAGAGDRSMVRLVAELRGRAAMNSLANLTGLGTAVMTGVPGLVLISPPAAAAVAVTTGAGVTAGGLAVGNSWWRRRRANVNEVLDGLLDTLEEGPSSRRKSGWGKRSSTPPPPPVVD